MNREFYYIPYKSRRNCHIKDKTMLSLLSKYSHSNMVQSSKQINKKVNLEIGFGSGEFILEKAQQNLNDIYLGCEVYNPGIVKLLKYLKQNDINNVYIYRGDARELLINTADLFFNDIYILFPDPWSKTKHHKRRLINQKFLHFIKRKFCADLHIMTDHQEYAHSILHDILQCNDYIIKVLEVKKERYYGTKFETKAILKSRYIFNFVLNHKPHNQESLDVMAYNEQKAALFQHFKL